MNNEELYNKIIENLSSMNEDIVFCFSRLYNRITELENKIENKER